MDFKLNDEQLLLRDTVKKLVKEKLMPLAAQFGEKNEVPWDIVKILAQQGLLGLHVPEKYGGSSRPGFEAMPLCLAREQLAPCLPAEYIFAVQGLGSYPIVVAGSEEQKEKWLATAAKGEKLFSFALTEPNAGSDVASMETKALPDGDFYILNGTKTFISNAGVADVYTVFAKTDPQQGVRGISAFVVEKGSPGLKMGRQIELISPHPFGELIFEDCRVPKSNLLGELGEGFKTAMRTLDVFRQTVGAMAVGLAQAALDLALEYAKQRITFGKPLVKFQGIQFMLADMAVEISAARLLVYQAAWLKDQGEEDFIKEASIAKLYATEMAQRVVYNAQQIFGGYGMTKDCPVEAFYRHIRATTVYEGTSEIQRVIIAKQLIERG
ncbi:MAG: acyl-CoA dehydrogenase family protein [Bacillota bacterium]